MSDDTVGPHNTRSKKSPLEHTRDDLSPFLRQDRLRRRSPREGAVAGPPENPFQGLLDREEEDKLVQKEPEIGITRIQKEIKTEENQVAILGDTGSNNEESDEEEFGAAGLADASTHVSFEGFPDTQTDGAENLNESETSQAETTHNKTPVDFETLLFKIQRKFKQTEAGKSNEKQGRINDIPEIVLNTAGPDTPDTADPSTGTSTPSMTSPGGTGGGFGSGGTGGGFGSGGTGGGFGSGGTGGGFGPGGTGGGTGTGGGGGTGGSTGGGTPAPSMAISIWNAPGETTFSGTRGAAAAEFMETFKAIALNQRWDDDAKAQFFPLYLKGQAKTWWLNERTSWERDPANTDSSGNKIPQSWGDVRAAFKDAFKSRLTEDELAHKLALLKYNPKEKVEDYCRKVLKLCTQLDKAEGTIMKESKRIKYLLMGLPVDVSKDIYLKSPQTTDEVMEKLIEHENYHYMMHRKKGLLQAGRMNSMTARMNSMTLEEKPTRENHGTSRGGQGTRKRGFGKAGHGYGRDNGRGNQDNWQGNQDNWRDNQGTSGRFNGGSFRGQGRGRSNGAGQGRGEVRCWDCDGPHFRRDCPRGGPRGERRVTFSENLERRQAGGLTSEK